MTRHILSLSPEQLTAFDLDAFVAHARRLNQHHRDTFTTVFPKAPSRWLSHYEFTPHALEFTSEGEIDGGLSWLVGATLDFSFTRALCASHYGARGAPCYDPASLIVLEMATKVDQYVDYAQLRQLKNSKPFIIKKFFKIPIRDQPIVNRYMSCPAHNYPGSFSEVQDNSSIASPVLSRFARPRQGPTLPAARRPACARAGPR